MGDYSHLTLNEKAAMTFLVVISSLIGIPVLRKVFQKGKCNFVATVLMMSMFSSFFYHLCEIYDFTIFLDKLQWQRMDNVFTISSIELMGLFLCGTLHDKSHFIEYSALINTIIIQEKDPWNFTYSVVPIVFYLLLGIFLRIYNHKKLRVIYERRNFYMALIFLTIGILFYLDGLDDQNDYLRFSHGMWHICIAIFGWYAFEGVQVTIIVNIDERKVFQPTFREEDKQKLLNQ